LWLPEIVEACEESGPDEKMPVRLPLASSRMLITIENGTFHVPDMLQFCAWARSTAIDGARTATISRQRRMTPPSRRRRIAHACPRGQRARGSSCRLASLHSGYTSRAAVRRMLPLAVASRRFHAENGAERRLARPVERPVAVRDDFEPASARAPA